MVIGEYFVWAHLPKTAGVSTRAMFDVLTNLKMNADDYGYRKQHDSFQHREKVKGLDLTRSRKRIMNIRRLPHYLISNRLFYYDRYGNSFTRQELMDGYIQLSDSPKEHLDHLLERMMGGRVDYWIRQENLADDFIKVMRNFVEISAEQEEQIRNLPRKNMNRGEVRGMGNEKKLEFWLTPADIAHLYSTCPLWASIEKEVYGNLFTLQLDDSESVPEAA